MQRTKILGLRASRADTHGPEPPLDRVSTKRFEQRASISISLPNFLLLDNYELKILLET